MASSAPKHPAHDGAHDPGEPFAALLREHRRAAGLTQEELAAAAGVSVRTISDLERSLRRTPQLESGRLLADALGLRGGARDCFLAAIRAQRLHRRPPVIARAPLPPQPAAMLGRERDLAELERRLAAGARVVTLAGAGGMGKTTLALEIAHRRRGAGEAVAWTPLENVTGPEGVLPAVARALGIAERAGVPPAQRIADAIAGRRLLLVLDNMEHVADAAPALADLLARAPSLAILATSRETLRIGNEEAQPLGPLPLPAPNDAGERLAANPAVALFLRAARRADPSPSDLEAAREVAILLDGLPLAIELAAAHAATVPLDRLPALLRHAGIEALGAGRRDGPGRFSSMEAALAWSEGRLPERSRRLLRLLGVFHGGFTVESVAGVAAAAGEPGLAGGLMALANAQLIRPAPCGSSRFSLLEPVRMYAAARLAAAGEEAAAQRAHAAWFNAWAAGQGALARGPDPLPALDAMEADIANLGAAIASPHADPAAAVQAAVMVQPVWEARGYISEGRESLETAIAAADRAGVPAPDLEWAVFWAAYFSDLLGDAKRARRWTERFTELAEAAGTPGMAAFATALRSRCFSRNEPLAREVAASLRAALGVMAETDPGLERWPIALVLGTEHLERGELAEALPLLRQAADLARLSGGALSGPTPPARYGIALWTAGERAAGRRLLLEAFAACGRLRLVTPALLPLAAPIEAGIEDGSPQRLEQAAVLLGGAEGLAARLSVAPGRYWSERFGRARERLSAALGEERLAALAADGAALDAPELLALAADWPEPTTG